MNKYIYDKNNTLVINGKVYVLAKERKETKNSVCAQCALYDMCIDGEDNHHLAKLCVPSLSDGRWFFLETQTLPEEGKVNLFWNFVVLLKHRYLSKIY